MRNNALFLIDEYILLNKWKQWVTFALFIYYRQKGYLNKINNYAHTLKKYVYCRTCIEVKNLWGFVPVYRTKNRLGRDLLNLFRFGKPVGNRKGSSPGYRFDNKPIFLECMGRLDRIDPVRPPSKNTKAFNGVFSEINAKTGVKWRFNGVSRIKLHDSSLFSGICENALTFSRLFMRD
jgi:hypothetical protein